MRISWVMRLRVGAAVLLFTLIVLQYCPAGAAWLVWYPEQRLTTDPAGSVLSANGARSLACDSAGNVHVVWGDYRTGSSGIYHKIYDGTSWSADSMITDPATVATNPAIAADEPGNVHIVWVDYRDGNAEIYYKSFDGLTWSASERLTNSSGSSVDPSIATGPDGELHVVWEDNRDSNWEIYYKTFDGIAWSADERLTSNAGISSSASVETDASGRIYVVWQDTRSGNFEIYFKRFDGFAWSTDRRITVDDGASENPTVDVGIDGIWHVVWDDDRGGDPEIYYKSYEGGAWSADHALTSSSGEATGPTIESDASANLHIVWEDTRGGNSDIYYKGYHGGTWGPSQPLTFTTQSCSNPSIAVTPDDSLHVVWQDERHGDPEIYWRWATGDLLGSVVITSIEPTWGFTDDVTEITNLTGENFLHQVEVGLARAGEADISAAGITVITPEKITCTFDLAGAALGYWDVTLENGNGERDTLPSGFEIVPWLKPVITSITPSEGTSLDTLEITDLAGEDFHPGAGVRLQKAGQSDIVATDVVVVSPGKITCTFVLTGPDGYWDVVVDNTDGQSDTLVAGFRMDPTPEPVIVSITPPGGENMETVEISDLAGENFRGGAAVRLQMAGQGDILATDVVVVSPGKITCVLLLDGIAGYWDVVVENPDTKSDTLHSGFEIVAWPKPVVNSITPSLGYTGEIIHVTDLAGGNFRDGIAVWLEKWGEPDIPATDVVVESPEKVTCTLTLLTGTEGTWDVVVENSDGLKDTLVMGFQIYPGTWTPDLRLTDAPYGSYLSRPNARCIAVDAADNLHVVWYDHRDGNNQIYYRKYDGAWGVEERLTSDPDESEYPSLAVDNSGNVHVVWSDTRDGHSEVYYKRHDGVAWGPDERLSSIDTPAQPARYPSIAVDASDNLNVVWQEYDGSTTDIAYRRFDGLIWSAQEIISDSTISRSHPALAADQYGNIHVVWWSSSNPIQYRKYDGVAWGPTENLGSSEADGAPSIAAGPDGRLHVVWHTSVWNGGGYVFEVFYKGYDGMAWAERVKMTSHPTASHNATIISYGDEDAYMVWMDDRDGDSEIYMRHLDGTTWSSETRLTYAGGESEFPFTAEDSESKLHLVWSDLRDGNREIYYKVHDPGVLSSVETRPTAPDDAALVRITPNPVVGGTELRFALEESADAVVSIYNTAGRLVWRTAREGLGPGTHSVRWHRRDALGRPVAPGVYFLGIDAGKTRATSKIVVLR